jgi:glycerol-3-phosphate dehydrogenase (NAD(P)+)
MNKNRSFAVIGGGSWATAIVKMLCEELDQVHWYMRNKEAIDHIEKEGHNPNYLSSVEFDPKQLKLTTDINEAVDHADYLIVAIPSAFVHKEFSKLEISLKNILHTHQEGMVGLHKDLFLKQCALHLLIVNDHILPE